MVRAEEPEATSKRQLWRSEAEPLFFYSSIFN